MSQEATGTDTARLRVLEGFDTVRKRPGMCVGSTGERGLHHLVFDVVERAVDEAPAGQGEHIDVTRTEDGGVQVAESGPDIAVEASGHTDGHGLEDMLTRLHTSARPSRPSHHGHEPVAHRTVRGQRAVEPVDGRGAP
ncbi:hypothetical protein [Streptomyces sp. AK04-3B]|uniref:hypothetical protein n=1 Tax=unclassified Streptomyces TaxID=2593676 RepID=UPI0029B52B96|nr:hypothetical protein [Streptomyces sp. AK04-3B]MDX3799345.1 hypothetical protein [Streptomyces sp. AK04-3B]